MAVNSLDTPVGATADAKGSVIFTVPSLGLGIATNMTFSVPDAPSSASFMLNLAGSPSGSWMGASSFGQVRVPGTTPTTITGTGLTPGVSYLLTITGQWGPPAELPPVQTFPTPLSVPSASSIASAAFTNSVVANSIQILAPTAGKAWTLFGLQLTLSSDNAGNVIIYQDPTGAVPPAAGETLYTSPAALGTFEFGFNGLITARGNGIYLTSSAGTLPSFFNAGTYQLGYS